MNAVAYGGRNAADVDVCLQAPTSTLDRNALATGAAARRTRLQEIEAKMDQACEAAVRRILPQRQADDRRSWGRLAWNVYVDEATRQARLHASDMAALKRDAQRLERLLECVA